MDAFAVSVAQGACCRPGLGNAARIGVAFGAAQGVMPLGGWALGTAFDDTIRSFDHWVALVLLALLGAKMIREGLHGEGKASPLLGWAAQRHGCDQYRRRRCRDHPSRARAPVLVACAAIGIVTAALCFAGVLIGVVWGVRIGRKAESC